MKRKASCKRRSVKRKASRKMSRKSTKKKASCKRRSAKKKASRKRRSAKKKASRKRRSVKKKASRKRKSTKNKFRVKGGKKEGSKSLVEELRKRRRSVQRYHAARQPTIMTKGRVRQRPTPMTQGRVRQRPTPMTQRRLRELRKRRQREQQWILLDEAQRKQKLFAGNADAVQNAQEALNAAADAGKVDRYLADQWDAHILLGPDGKFRRPNPNDLKFFDQHAGFWTTLSGDGKWGPKQEEVFQFLNKKIRDLSAPVGPNDGMTPAEIDKYVRSLFNPPQRQRASSGKVESM